MLIAALLGALTVAPAVAADDPRRGEQWGLAMVEGVEAWPTSTGVGTLVAVIDSGVQADHPDLGGRLVPGYDFVGDDPIEGGDEDGTPEDGDGHGTHVSGIVAANRDNGEGIAGVAPDARVLPLRVLDDNGEGYADDTIRAVDKAVDMGAHVINLSLGDSVPLQSQLFGDEAFEAALRRAVTRGILVVLAAGNYSLPHCENPQLGGTVCVGAVDPRRQRSVFSSFGSGVHVMAPGGSGGGGASEDVLSTYTNSRYASVAGTSQAAPHVAGIGALLVSLGVNGQDAAKRIVETAVDPGVATAQYRIANARAAVAGLALPPPPPPPDSGGDPGPPPPPAATGKFSVKSPQKARTVSKRGIAAACTAARPGPCVVKAYHRGRKIGGKGGDVPAQFKTTVYAVLNKRGRKLVTGLKKRVRVTVKVTLPGEATRARRITIRR